MKAYKNGQGVVFDIRANALESFLENFARLQETDDRIDFEVEKCQALPELEEEGFGGGGNWRDQGRDGGGYSRGYGGHGDNSYGGGYRGNRGYGGGGNSYGGGGYGGKYRSDNRDYYDRDSGPSGGWGRNRGGQIWSNRDYDDEEDYNNSGGQSWGRNDGGYQKRDYGGASSGKAHDGSYQGGGFGKRADIRPKTAAQAVTSGPNVQLIGSKPKSGGSGSMVYVSNLKFSANEQDLIDFFKQNKFDPVRARLLYDNEGNSKGTGYVELKTTEDANDAIDTLQGELCGGRPVRIALANK